MPTPDLCSEEEVSELVHTFYGHVRDDAVLGPIFGRHVKDWDTHLARMVDFWSSALRGTARFRGTPMRERANDLARRIADSLWYGYRLSRQADPLARAL
ncbi:MAG TPA: group III truncated hemoglobin [Ramlibacter sp.]|nr:group III truncated hemoglobin [Ramlibacter sp.]